MRPRAEGDEAQNFLEAPFEWCLAHELALLHSDGLALEEREGRELEAARVEVKACPELRRLLAQEGLPTCVASGKLVGVGTLRWGPFGGVLAGSAQGCGGAAGQ